MYRYNHSEMTSDSRPPLTPKQLVLVNRAARFSLGITTDPEFSTVSKHITSKFARFWLPLNPFRESAAISSEYGYDSFKNC